MPTRIVRPRLAPVALVAVLAAAACRGDPISVRDPDAVYGTARVSVTTFGVNPDPDGFTLDIRGAQQEHLPTNGEVSLSVLEGEARLTLHDVADNCTAVGTTDRSVAIVHGQETQIGWFVVCGGGGDKIVFGSTASGNGDIYVLDTGTGSEQQISSSPWRDSDPVWSPSGNRVAYATASPDSITGLIRIVSLAGDSLGTIGTVGSHTGYPAWSPREDRIAYVSDVTGNFELYTARIDGSDARRLTNTAEEEFRPAWSPDGDRILYDAGIAGDTTGRALYSIEYDGAGKHKVDVGGRYEFHAAYSPDGRQIAWASKRDSNIEVYVADRDGSNVRRLTNNGAEDGAPSWSADGMWIIFASNRGGTRHLYKMRPDGSGQTPITSTAFDEYDPTVSR